MPKKEPHGSLRVEPAASGRGFVEFGSARMATDMLAESF